MATQKGAEHWDATTIRRMVENDAYLARPHEEVATLVSPEVAARLEPGALLRRLLVQPQRHKRVHTGPTRNVHTENAPSEWIAVPVPDPGVPARVGGGGEGRHNGQREVPPTRAATSGSSRACFSAPAGAA